MALRNQPYIPLYVKDYLGDEKLRECKPESVGVYSFVLCVLHKQDEYGCLLLRQNDKQSDKQILNFALKLGKHLPYSCEIIESAISDLVENGVLKINGDILSQKRMVKDNDISEKRSKAGLRGGFASKFAQAKIEANTVIENVNEYGNTLCYDLNQTEKILLESETWKESVAKNYNIQISKVDELIKNFISNCRVQDIQIRSLAETKIHFTG
ncbi:MAG: hypothetical protein WC389_20355, partial [Lutibacter sp.]